MVNKCVALIRIEVEDIELHLGFNCDVQVDNSVLGGCMINEFVLKRRLKGVQIGLGVYLKRDEWIELQLDDRYLGCEDRLDVLYARVGLQKVGQFLQNVDDILRSVKKEACEANVYVRVRERETGGLAAEDFGLYFLIEAVLDQTGESVVADHSQLLQMQVELVALLHVGLDVLVHLEFVDSLHHLLEETARSDSQRWRTCPLLSPDPPLPLVPPRLVQDHVVDVVDDVVHLLLVLEPLDYHLVDDLLLLAILHLETHPLPVLIKLQTAHLLTIPILLQQVLLFAIVVQCLIAHLYILIVQRLLLLLCHQTMMLSTSIYLPVFLPKLHPLFVCVRCQY